MNVARYVQALKDRDTVHWFDDFLLDITDDGFVDTVTDTGTVAVGDGVNGVVTLTPSDGTVADNDEAYIERPNETLLFGANRQIYLCAKLRFTEVAAGVANIAFGAQNAVGADSIIDNGEGLKVSGSTLGIYKVDGEQVWRCVSANNSASTVTQSTAAAVAATDYILEIEAVERDSASMTVTFKVNGEYLKDSNGYVIRHTVLIASATEMQMFAGIKLGAATNNDTLLVDYWFEAQTRV